MESRHVPIEAARGAASAKQWEEAAERFALADEEGMLSAADLELYGYCQFWCGLQDAAIETWERSFSAHRDVGSRREAARLAAFIAGEYKEKMQPSAARGWLRRARRLLEGAPECIEHGHVAFQEASLAVASGHYDEAVEWARECARIARAFGNDELEALALVREGVALVALGDVDTGLELIDEASAAAAGGGLSTFAAGVIYCNTIGTCRAVADLARAAEWTDRASDWCRDEAVAGLPGICRVTRAAIVRLRGSLHEALDELSSAVDELRSFNPGAYAEAHYELGVTQLLLGDLNAAESAFSDAHRAGHVSEPGMSMLRTRRGDAAGACRTLRTALGDSAPLPRRAILLPALIEAALAAGDLDTARAAAGELEGVRDRLGGPVIEAQLAQACGAIALVEGRPREALDDVRTALDLWNDKVRAPYEVALTRELMGQAHRQLGDEASAVSELQAAREALAELGVKRPPLFGEELLRVAAGRTVVRAFMFTDIADSTRLLDALGDEKWHRQLRQHNELTRRLVAEHAGRIVKSTGDGVFATFERPDRALACAIELQRAAARELIVDLRIGVHASDAIEIAGDFEGRGVHLAARLLDRAEPGEIVATAETVEEAGFDSIERRTETLRGLAEPVEIATIAWRSASV